jgi:hypothetical protein
MMKTSTTSPNETTSLANPLLPTNHNHNYNHIRHPIVHPTRILNSIEILNMSSKRPRSPSPAPTPSIFRSTKVHEQTSSFMGAFSPTLPATTLQSLPEFRSATHKIAGWRKPSRQKSLTPASKVLYETGFDDDGESWAGSRLQRVLNDTQTEGVVVVARWYGGQNIGRVRFTHIENCAREAIRAWKMADADAQRSAAAKKQRVEDEVARKELTEDLRQRDFNIFALRKLLGERKAKLHDEVAVPPTPQKTVNYEGMGLEALRRMDKARDATVAFILKQIDKVDEEIKLAEELDEAALDGLGDVQEEGGQQERRQGETQEEEREEKPEAKQEEKQKLEEEEKQEEKQSASPSKQS